MSKRKKNKRQRTAGSIRSLAAVDPVAVNEILSAVPTATAQLSDLIKSNTGLFPNGSYHMVTNTKIAQIQKMIDFLDQIINLFQQTLNTATKSAIAEVLNNLLTHLDLMGMRMQRAPGVLGTVFISSKNSPNTAEGNYQVHENQFTLAVDLINKSNVNAFEVHEGIDATSVAAAAMIEYSNIQYFFSNALHPDASKDVSALDKDRKESDMAHSLTTVAVPIVNYLTAKNRNMVMIILHGQQQHQEEVMAFMTNSVTPQFIEDKPSLPMFIAIALAQSFSDKEFRITAKNVPGNIDDQPLIDASTKDRGAQTGRLYWDPHMPTSDVVANLVIDKFGTDRTALIETSTKLRLPPKGVNDPRLMAFAQAIARAAAWWNNCDPELYNIENLEQQYPEIFNDMRRFGEIMVGTTASPSMRPTTASPVAPPPTRSPVVPPTRSPIAPPTRSPVAPSGSPVIPPSRSPAAPPSRSPVAPTPAQTHTPAITATPTDAASPANTGAPTESYNVTDPPTWLHEPSAAPSSKSFLPMPDDAHDDSGAKVGTGIGLVIGSVIFGALIKHFLKRKAGHPQQQRSPGTLEPVVDPEAIAPSSLPTLAAMETGQQPPVIFRRPARPAPPPPAPPPPPPPVQRAPVRNNNVTPLSSQSTPASAAGSGSGNVRSVRERVAELERLQAERRRLAGQSAIPPRKKPHKHGQKPRSGNPRDPTSNR